MQIRWPAYLQSLDICSEAWDAHEALISDLEHSLEIAIDRHELGREARVRRYRYTVLSLHGHHGVAVVLVDTTESIL